MATLDEIIGKYDPTLNVAFMIPGDQPGQQGSTINVNTLDEGATDQLIQKYGGAPQLLARKDFLRATREKNAAPVIDPYDQYYKEAEQRATGLQGKLDEIFGQQADYGSQLIDQAYAPERSRAISEEAALGRLTSPVSLSTGAPIDRADTARRNAKTQLFSGLAGQRAGAQSDIAKTIEQIFGNQQALGLQNKQFGQTMDWDKNKFQAGINESAADRILRDIMSTRMGSGSSGGGDMLGGALSGGVAGAAAGSKAHPLWGTLIGGLAGSGLGAYGESRRK